MTRDADPCVDQTLIRLSAHGSEIIGLCHKPTIPLRALVPQSRKNTNLAIVTLIVSLVFEHHDGSGNIVKRVHSRPNYYHYDVELHLSSDAFTMGTRRYGYMRVEP